MGFNPSLSGKYFKDRLIAANELLDNINLRFQLDNDTLHPIYYWILDIERAAKTVGMHYYSRRGRKTLIGHLQTDRIWLRSKIYMTSKFTKKDLLNSAGRLKSFKTQSKVIDFEKLISDIAQETKVLKKLLSNYTKEETKLIAEFKLEAQKKLKEFY